MRALGGRGLTKHEPADSAPIDVGLDVRSAITLALMCVSAITLAWRAIFGFRLNLVFSEKAWVKLGSVKLGHL